jgi:uncharacterized protein
MIPVLDETEARVAGALIEKQLTTPEYYPLSLNALTNACNQKNNRDPIVAYDESRVMSAIDRLRAKNIVITVTGTGIRVPKYKQNLTTLLSLAPGEVAAMCVLLLRGPQTVGEIRTRTAPMHEFGNLAEVEEVLAALGGRTPDPLTVQLPRRPGQKEVRFCHLLSGSPALTTTEPVVAVPAGDPRIEQLETDLRALREMIEQIANELAEFKKQFDAT